MKVAEVMTRNVSACSERDSLSKAARIMWENDCGCVPVLDASEKVIGMVTDRDICMAAYTQGLPLHALRTESAMARTLASCSSDDDVTTVEELMRQNRVRRLPVVDKNGHLVGIVSLTDLALEAERNRRGAGGKVTAGEVAETLSTICQPRGHAVAQFQFGPEPGEREFVPAPPPKRGPWRK
jgi:CBS domain-containing protein